MSENNSDYSKKLEYSKKILNNEIEEYVKYLKKYIISKYRKDIENEGNKHNFEERFEKLEINISKIVNIYAENNTVDILKKINSNVISSKVNNSLKKYRNIRNEVDYYENSKNMYKDIDVDIDTFKDINDIIFGIEANSPKEEIIKYVKESDIIKCITSKMDKKDIEILKKFIDSEYYEDYINSRKDYENLLNEESINLIRNAQDIVSDYFPFPFISKTFISAGRYYNEYFKK